MFPTNRFLLCGLSGLLFALTASARAMDDDFERQRAGMLDRQRRVIINNDLPTNHGRRG